MSDPDFVDKALTAGGSIIGGGGFVGIMVRLLMGGVTKRLDSIDASLKDQRKELAESRKEQNSRHEAMLERVVKVEGKATSAHARLDALITPVPKRKKKRKT